MPHHLRRILYNLSWKAATTQLTKAQIDNVDTLVRRIRYNPYVMEDYFSWELTLLLDSVPAPVLAHVLGAGEQLTSGLSQNVWDHLKADSALRAHAGRTWLNQIVEPAMFAQRLGLGTVYHKHTTSKGIKYALWDSGDPDLMMFTDYATAQPGDKRSIVLFENKTKASLQPYQVIYYMNQLFWAASVTGFFDFAAMVFVFDRGFNSALGERHLPSLFREDRAAWLEQIKQTDQDSQGKIDAIRHALEGLGLWDKFKAFCASLPIAMFEWQSLLDTLVAALQPACQDVASKMFAQKIVANINDFKSTLRPDGALELSYDRYVELEDMIDLKNVLDTGKRGNMLAEMFMGLNKTIRGVIGAEGVKLVEHIEQSPTFRLIPEQLNKNLASPASDRAYLLFAEGIPLARLKASDKMPSGWELYVREGAEVFKLLGIDGWASSDLGAALRAVDPAGNGRYFDAGPHFVPVVKLLWSRVCEQSLRG